MISDLEKIYKNFVINNLITYDESQVSLLNKIQKIFIENKKFNFFSKKKKLFGFYVYGSVGIGKTFMLNLFIQNCKNAKKYHFNNFMINLHAYINNQTENKEMALEKYIKKISKENSVIFIDELHIFNIVDALLIQSVFNFLKKYKIFVLISSNFCPDDLYENGLQRNDFLPFIEFLKQNFKVFHLRKTQDYRRKMLNRSKTYFTPINEITINEFNLLFDTFVEKKEIYISQIKSKSRILRFEKSTANIAYCKFTDLCAKNLGSEDYMNMAKAFSLIFIYGIPQFSISESDQCRRFISLIDMLYDNDCSVVILAQKPINQLCLVKNLLKEFERTTSRLYEMTIMKSQVK